MSETLYSQLTNVEDMDETLKELKSSNLIDVSQLQKELFRRYESNPVLYDAMQDRQSVSESLEELAQVNKGIRRILPWKKDKVHNERLEQIGELIRAPYHLRTNGIFMPDNFCGMIAMAGILAYGTSNILFPLLINPSENSEDIQRVTHVTRFVLPAFMTLTIGPLIGLGAQLQRSAPLPINQAKYLDEKIEEFYK